MWALWAGSHPLILELLDDVIEKRISGFHVGNVKAHDNGRKLPAVVLEYFRVEVVNGI